MTPEEIEHEYDIICMAVKNRNDFGKYMKNIFGLALSMGLILMAFEWKTPLPNSVVDLHYSSIQDVEVVRGIGAGCDEEVIRVLENPPKWEPGKQRGRPVKVRMIIPVAFKLG